MEKVIILKGASDRGKTPTLNLLIDHLGSNYGASIELNEGHTKDITKDCFVIVNVPTIGKVGIITYGDSGTEDAVKKALDKCLKEGCSSLIGASHVKYNGPNVTVYKLLWDFAASQNAMAVETTTYIEYKGWGKEVDETHLNDLCAHNLAYLLKNL